MKASVALDASVHQPSGHVHCVLRCDGQEVKVVFTGTEVRVDVPESGTPAASAVPPSELFGAVRLESP